jgi:hypothetical protein
MVAGFADEWDTAPKDGSIINVQFPDRTWTKARWNKDTGHWEVPQRDKWVPMRVVRIREPVAWWVG